MATVSVVATRLICHGSKWSHGQNSVLCAKRNLITNGGADSQLPDRHKDLLVVAGMHSRSRCNCEAHPHF